MKTIYGFEVECDNCAALKRAVKTLLWRRVAGGGSDARFIFCVGYRCSGLSVEVYGKVRGALYRAASMLWTEYRRLGGKSLRVKVWRFFRNGREPALRRTYTFGRKRPNALRRCYYD